MVLARLSTASLLESGPGGRGRECFGIPEWCRCKRAWQELAQEILRP